jgi:hypothetical protein
MPVAPNGRLVNDRKRLFPESADPRHGYPERFNPIQGTTPET